jgi:hypothetical protein
MIFNEYGLPKDTGASDYMDSARLVGLLALIEYPQRLHVELLQLYNNKGVCYRYPCVDPNWAASNNPNNVTRDQIVLLAAGFNKEGLILECNDILNRALNSGRIIKRAQNTEADIVGSTKPWYNGADILTPSVMNHLRISAKLPPRLLGKLWLLMDLTFHALFTPMREPNQILAMAMVAGPKYLNYFKRINKKLDASIRDYWSGWRGEPELAEYLITYLKTK